MELNVSPYPELHQLPARAHSYHLKLVFVDLGSSASPVFSLLVPSAANLCIALSSLPLLVPDPLRHPVRIPLLPAHSPDLDYSCALHSPDLCTAMNGVVVRARACFRLGSAVY